MEEFGEKLSISEERNNMDTECGKESGIASKTVALLRDFLTIQQRRAQAYARLKRYNVL